MHLPHIQPFEKSPLYFFTASVEGRRPVLACQSAFEELTGIWTRSAALDGWYVGRYMLMPDHVHFFAMPASDVGSAVIGIKCGNQYRQGGCVASLRSYLH